MRLTLISLVLSCHQAIIIKRKKKKRKKEKKKKEKLFKK